MITRKERHAEAILKIATAIEAMDQAYSMLKDAGTQDLDDSNGPYRISAHRLLTGLMGLMESADTLTCEDCGHLVRDCNCYFAQPIGGRR